MIVADGNSLSHEQPVRKYIEAEAIGMRGARSLQSRDSLAHVTCRAKVLRWRGFALTVEDKTRRRRANQFLGGCSESGAEIRVGQVEYTKQGDLQCQNQLWIAWHIPELTIFGVEESLRLLECGDAAICRIEERECPWRIVATAALQCADGGQRIVSPAILDDTIAVAGVDDERRGVQSRFEEFNGIHSLLSTLAAGRSSRSRTSPAEPNRHAR
jgi:hypothetical protein